MAGTWDKQDKVIPGAYINLLTNTPLSISVGERGTVLIAQELSVGTDNDIYEIAASEGAYPENASTADKKLAKLALMGAKTVLLYWYIRMPSQGLQHQRRSRKSQPGSKLCRMTKARM